MQSPAPALHAARILVVDDDVDVLHSLVLLLEGAGYAVEGATSASQALRLHERASADLVLTDIFMPDTDGLETVATFRRASPGLKIIAMSGGGQLVRGNYLELARLAGADALLQKPFDPLRLIHLLDTLLAPA